MIDLHIHTNYSDGTDSVEEILYKAHQANLDVISITDHNCCLAFHELDKNHLHHQYKFKLIVGCEFTTSFEGRLIEILGYGFDHRGMNSFLHQEYNSVISKKRVEMQRELLVKKINALGLLIHMDQIRSTTFPGERFERPFYEALCRSANNKAVLFREKCDTFGNFYRNGLTNPNSKFYVGYDALYPSLDVIVEQIHIMGGIAFLAHPFQYRFQGLDTFLENIVKCNCLDGIECFHTACTRENMEYLSAFADKHHLLISGGSDYHGKNKTLHDLGVGCGNLNINPRILSNWKINYYE